MEGESDVLSVTRQLFLKRQCLFSIFSFAFNFSARLFFFFSSRSITLVQMAKVVDAIKSCRLVLQRAPMGSISVNTTFHLEPPAWQACLRICFGFPTTWLRTQITLVHGDSKRSKVSFFFLYTLVFVFFFKKKLLIARMTDYRGGFLCDIIHHNVW